MSATERSSLRRAVLVALGAAAVDVLAVGVFHEVSEARGALLGAIGGGLALHDADAHLGARAAVLHHPDAAFASRAVTALDVAARTLAIGGAVLAVLALSAMVIALLRARRRGALATLAVASPAAIVGAVGAGTWSSARAYLLQDFRPPCIGGQPGYEALYGAFAAHAGPYETARLCILAVAILSTLAALAVVRRSPSAPAPQPLRRPLLVPGALFAVGLAAFALTRAHAADLRNPMPFVLMDERLPLPVAQAAALPLASRCEHLREAPFVALDAQGLVVNGIAVQDQAEMVRVLAARREEWRLVQPNHPFPGVVSVAIPADAELEAVRPFIAAVRAAGYPLVDLVEVRKTKSWTSRTLGEVTYLPRGCAVQLEAGRDLPPSGTWGEMALALSPRSAAREDGPGAVFAAERRQVAGRLEGDSPRWEK